MAVVLYFVVGGVYLYRVRGARGWEVIPHHKLWKEFPFLVKASY